MKNNPQDSSPALQEQWQRFGALLRERRNAAKLSRVKLARQAKVCDTTIKFTETARHRPSRATLVCLLAVDDLHLTWADVPGGLHEPFAKKKEIPAAPLPSSTPAPVENKEIPAAPLPSPPAPWDTSPDPARFLMDLIGFDEIPLPMGAPKTLRIFQQRPRVDGQVSGKNRSNEREGE